MIFLQLVTPANAMLFKAVRLRALGDTPTAFSSTYAAESRLSDRNWIERAQEWSSNRSTTYLAIDVENPCGIVSGFFDQDDPTHAHLASMWVAQSHRRSRIGRTLVNAIIEWARLQGAATLQLVVTRNNHPAIEFYKSLGFSPTGKMAPYRNDPTLNNIEMIRSISSQRSSD
jgi:ribosomal protein S18 acetylase RimI-like enzyme